ncbi:hypothetical protein V5S96_01445 [Corynebacterium mastitidis]|uniref:Type II secretion system protein GspF domain-containing protein n=1 Tax=Corynebacterium mastitidis TaxID=161890 RepID=A0ABU8NVJ8_9CORY
MLAHSLAGLGGALLVCAPSPGGRVAEVGRFHPSRLASRWVIPGLVGTAVVVGGAMPPSAVLSAAMVAGASWVILRARLRDRRAQRQRRWVSGVMGLVIHQLRSGAQPAPALRDAARREERLDAEVRAGLRAVAAGMEPTPESVRLVPELAVLHRLWEAAQDRGVSPVPLLDHLRASTERGMRHRCATRARLVGPQSTAVVLSLLPLAGVALGTAMGARPVALLLGGGLGGVLLMSGTALISLGALWSYWLIERAGGQR